MTNSSDDFEKLWEESKKFPLHKEVSLDKIELDLHFSDLVDKYLDFTKRAVGQAKMKKEAYDELRARTSGLKDALGNIDERVVERLGRSETAKRLRLRRR